MLLQGIVTNAVLSSVTVLGWGALALEVMGRGAGTLFEVAAGAVEAGALVVGAGALESVAATVEYLELSVQLQSSKVRVVASVTVKVPVP